MRIDDLACGPAIVGWRPLPDDRDLQRVRLLIGLGRSIPGPRPVGHSGQRLARPDRTSVWGLLATPKTIRLAIHHDTHPHEGYEDRRSRPHVRPSTRQTRHGTALYVSGSRSRWPRVAAAGHLDRPASVRCLDRPFGNHGKAAPQRCRSRPQQDSEQLCNCETVFRYEILPVCR